jgi:gliding motility-associated-like protein
MKIKRSCNRAIYLSTAFILLFASNISAQNSMVGDGFGGRLWYQPTNYTVGSYSGYSVCPEGESNQLYGWGANNSGQIGYSTPYGFDLPVPVPGMDNVKFYTTGYLMSAIKNDNTGWFWGGSFTPAQIISDVKFTDAAIDFVSFVKNDGTVWSLGTNIWGVFGDGTTVSEFAVPKQMIGVTNAVRLACSSTVNYVLTAEGKVLKTVTTTNMTEQIAGLSNVVDIKANSLGLLILNNVGDVFYLDNGTNLLSSVSSGKNIVAISGSCDGSEFLFLGSDKVVYYLNSGITIVPFPEVVANDAIDIMMGETFSYIVKSNYSLWCEGSSTDGSIWLNLSNEPRDEYTQLDPSQIPDLCSVNGTAPPVVVETNLFIPNVFTPNNDGANDVFVIEHNNFSEGKLSILNRWGQVMIETEFPHFSWDGYCQGQLASEGVYFYHLKCKDGNGEEFLKHGFFHLK